MRKLSIIFIVVIFTLGCGLFGSQSYDPKEYISTTGVASPDTETKIELEDGAAIVIPASAIGSEVSIKVERNPEKANNLPPLDEGVVGVGDFYNFEIDGTLNGPVDLVLPFDPDSVPENKEGVLVVAIPTENGWKYTPVVPDGNKVTLYTDEVGDPIIAWHFACIDKVDLNYEGQPEDPCEEERAKKLVCDPDISLQVIQNGEQFEIVGSVVPVAKNFFGSTVSEPASNITVDLNLNLRETGSGQRFSVQTDENGSFSYNLDSSQLKEGWNWVFAKAECDPWWGKLVVESNGYAEFKYTPAVVQQPASTSIPQSTAIPTATVIPAPVETSIPSGAILLPDFVGQDIDNAIEWLKSNGFKYTWIDGSSTYDLGVVFKQAPSGGQYKVPHRTVVVLYRTIEQVADPCEGLNLTPEECLNIGAHEYSYFETFSGNMEEWPEYIGDERPRPCFGGRSPEQGIVTVNHVFSDGVYYYGGFWMIEKIKPNTYYIKEGDNKNYQENTFIFTEGGFIREISFGHESHVYLPIEVIYMHICTITETFTLLR